MFRALQIIDFSQKNLSEEEDSDGESNRLVKMKIKLKSKSKSTPTRKRKQRKYISDDEDYEEDWTRDII